MHSLAGKPLAAKLAAIAIDTVHANLAFALTLYTSLALPERVKISVPRAFSLSTQENLSFKLNFSNELSVCELSVHDRGFTL